MIRFLARWLIQDHKNFKDEQVRSAYGTLCGALGIAFNLLLFAGKYIAGVLSHSVAITADSFNNLSDAGSSILMLFGFRLAGKKADAEHPFGHGRMEYVTGMIISILVLFMGVELLRSSFEKILHPQTVSFSILSASILAVSIGVKLYMAFYNRSVGFKINSSAMRAAAADSISDTVATTVVLLSMIISHYTGWQLDGYCGVLVAFFILYTGYSSIKDTLGELLGKSPDPVLVQALKETVLSYPEVVGIHDLLIHDYGPGRFMVSLHAEVPGNHDVFLLHDVIDRIEMELMERFHCEVTIHMDPVEVDNKRVAQARSRLMCELKNIDEAVSVHDFRMVTGPTHTNFIFDLEVPVDFALKDEQIRCEVESMVAKKFDNTFAVFKIDRIRF